MHISNILKEKELEKNSVVKEYLTTSADGKELITHKQMQEIALGEYEQFDARRKAYEAKLADRQDEEELRQLEVAVNNRQKEIRV
jgi:hypothetical protein